MRVGDLVTYCGNGKLYIIIHTYPNSWNVDIVNTTTGKKSSLPSNWLTIVKTDKK